MYKQQPHPFACVDASQYRSHLGAYWHRGSTPKSGWTRISPMWTGIPRHELACLRCKFINASAWFWQWKDFILMAWIRFTKPIPEYRSTFINSVRVPSSVIESWQKWFESKGIQTRIECKNGIRILYRWMGETDLEGLEAKGWGDMDERGKDSLLIAHQVCSIFEHAITP